MPYKNPETQKVAQRAAMQKKRTEEKKQEQKQADPTGGKRARNWTFVVYPESCPQNWKEILSDLHIPVGISPIHDRDVNDDGSPKKPHYHIALAFRNMKSYGQILEISKALNGTKKVEVIRDMRGMVRYFVHKDNPEKCQDYKTSDIVSIGGFDAQEYLKPTATEGFALQVEMLEFVEDYGVDEFQDLVAYARHERPDWLQELARSAFLIKETIKSRRHSGRMPINPVTGELYETKKFTEQTEKQAEINDKMAELNKKMAEMFGKKSAD